MSYSPGSQKRYNDKNYTFITLKLHNEKEADIIKAVDDVMNEDKSSRQAAVKKIILEKIKAGRK